jgi:hypothetical protein
VYAFGPTYYEYQHQRAQQAAPPLPPITRGARGKGESFCVEGESGKSAATVAARVTAGVASSAVLRDSRRGQGRALKALRQALDEEPRVLAQYRAAHARTAEAARMIETLQWASVSKSSVRRVGGTPAVASAPDDRYCVLY